MSCSSCVVGFEGFWELELDRVVVPPAQVNLVSLGD
jgi:hypothetical protein